MTRRHERIFCCGTARLRHDVPDELPILQSCGDRRKVMLDVQDKLAVLKSCTGIAQLRSDTEAEDDFERRGLVHSGAEAGRKRGCGVGVDLRVVRRARNGDIGKPCADQFCVNRSVNVHNNAVGGEPLGAVARDGVAVVKVAHLGRIERHVFPVVHLYLELTSPVNLFHGAEVAVGHDKLPIRRGEVKATAHHPNASENEPAETNDRTYVYGKSFKSAH